MATEHFFDVMAMVFGYIGILAISTSFFLDDITGDDRQDFMFPVPGQPDSHE